MKTNALKGMKDILPDEQRLRDYVQNKILEVYKASGFERISTPMLEDAENLDKSDGGDNLNLIFKVLKRGDKLTSALESNDVTEKSLSDMGLRYDLTLPLTRFYAANRNELQFPFKVIQTDRVYRAERPQKGRSREFVQCDIDILGDKSCNAEVELIDVTARALLSIIKNKNSNEALIFDNFIININDRRVLRNMLESMGFAPDTLDSVCITFDKLDKIGIDGIKAELEEKQFPQNAIMKLVNFCSNTTMSSDGTEFNVDDVVKECNDKSIGDDLKYIINTVKKISNGDYIVRYCPSLVRGQGYYTGVVFEITNPNFGGAIGGGGRYDKLIGKFIGEDIPAVGFSIGFERICSILLDTSFEVPDEKRKLALLYDDEIEFSKVIKKAEELRKDYSVSILHKAKKMGPMFSMLENKGYKNFCTNKGEDFILKSSEN
ncbi:MAG: ATP phosphoribosyltransferase regulatory subunit [Treponema sp.]|nr:ATP phosphoribosyltransferase regulatory subunit [Treponema sp.]